MRVQLPGTAVATFSKMGITFVQNAVRLLGNGVSVNQQDSETRPFYPTPVANYITILSPRDNMHARQVQ